MTDEQLAIRIVDPGMLRASRSAGRRQAPPGRRGMISQMYGVRDCVFRDPAGNLIRIQELR